MTVLSKFQRFCGQLPSLGLVHDGERVALKLLQDVQAMSDGVLFGGSIHDSDMAKAARAGLLLAAGGWEEAHRIVQELDTAEARYWHGMIHRREPDSGNAKYWFRRLGYHQVFEKLGSEATRETLPGVTAFDHIVKMGQWDPFRFVDLCIACEEGHQLELRGELEALQEREFMLLLGFCFEHALKADFGNPFESLE